MITNSNFTISQFFMLTENEAPQGARYSRQESIDVHPLVPKGILSVRQTGIVRVFQILTHLILFNN